jgi:hypothetical protein
MQLPFRGQVQTQHALESRSSTSAISELPDPRPSSMRRPHSKIQNSITAPADAAIGVKPLAPNPDDPSRRPRDRRSPPRSRPSHNSLVRRGSPPPAVPPTAGLHRADARTLSCSRTFVPFVIRLPPSTVPASIPPRSRHQPTEGLHRADAHPFFVFSYFRALRDSALDGPGVDPALILVRFRLSFPTSLPL